MKVLVTLVAIVLLGCACVGPFSELQERQYPTADAARAADPGGWIPPILPNDAANRPAEIFRDFSWWPATMSGNAQEAWEFREEPRCSACRSTVVRVGIDGGNGMVCFHRKN